MARVLGISKTALIVITVLLAFAVGVALGGVLGPGYGAGAEEVEEVVILVNPGVAKKVSLIEARELEMFLEDRISRYLGRRVDVEIYYPTSVAAVIEALKFGHAQVALGVGSLVGALAVKYAGAELALVEYRSVIINGSRTVAPYYFSYFVALRDSEFRTLEDVRGKRACFPSELSTSGFIMPMRLLVEKGLIDPRGVSSPRELAERYFGEVIFGGGYAQCWEALRKGIVDVSVIAGDVVEELYWEVMNNTRVLAVAGPNPSHVVVIKGLEGGLREAVIRALMDLNEKPELMRKYVSAIFVRFGERSLEEHLGPLIEALEIIGLSQYYLERGGS